MGQITSKYLKRETGSSESYKDISTVPFPVLTICPTYPYKDDRLKYHGVDIVRDLQVSELRYSQVLYINQANVSVQVTVGLQLFKCDSQRVLQ